MLTWLYAFIFKPLCCSRFLLRLKVSPGCCWHRHCIVVAGVAATASLAAATPWVNYIVMNKFMTEFVNPNKGIQLFLSHFWIFKFRWR